MAITFDDVVGNVQTPAPSPAAAPPQAPRSSADDWRDDRIRLADLEHTLLTRRARLHAD